MKWLQLSLLCAVLQQAAGHRILSPTSAGWTVAAIPNPMKDPTACGRPGIEHSAVCDPEKVMSTAAQDIVEDAINNATSAEIATVLIPHMDTSNYHSDIDETAKRMAMQLHDTWGVGGAAKQNGVLILVSSKDRAVFISVGSGVQSRLTDRTLDAIISRMKPHLKKSSWEGGFVSAILDISQVLSTGAALQTTDENSPLQDFAGFVVIVGVILAISFFKSRSDNRRERELTRGRAALDSLIKDVKNVEHRVYMSSSCPMCLEDFAAEAELGEAGHGSMKTSGTLVPKTLPCGHVFCEPCTRLHFNVSATTYCPVCREVLYHVDEGTAGECECSSNGQTSDQRDGHHQHRYRNHMQTMLIQSRRLHTLYPTALDPSTHSILETAVRSGSLSDAILVVERRSIEVQSMNEIYTTAGGGYSSPRSSGSSLSSFGDGGDGYLATFGDDGRYSSSRGRGGRF